MDYLSPSTYLGGSSSRARGQPPPIPGSNYISTLHSYLTANAARISSSASTSSRQQEGSVLQQSYTLLTLGLDPSSAPLSRSLVVPLSLGFAGSSAPSGRKASSSTKPLTVRLPPDRLLYLLLRWQDLPQALPHVGKTDDPISPGVSTAARGARGGMDADARKQEGDVQSVRSWVGSVRTVGGQSTTSRNYAPSRNTGWGSWWGSSRKELTKDEVLISLYTSFNLIPSLIIHPPLLSDPQIEELVENGAYTQLGGVDTKVPLNVLRNLQKLELEGYDPRCLAIPCMPGLKSLTVTDVQDADDWLEDLVSLHEEGQKPSSRFPNLRYLAVPSTSLLSLPPLPLSHLAHLDLSGNLLDSLPSSLASLHTLISLNLSSNVITSVRNAPQVLGNITTLNLSKNRIDCLIGLERLLGLERLDVRGNELRESSEVGRLSLLPHIREIWCEANPFERYEERDTWRAELGVAFAEGGEKDVVFDGQPWTWSEKRKIEATLAARGGHRRGQTTPARSRPQSTYTTASVRSVAPQQAEASSSTPNARALPKKRRKQRIVDLDGTVRHAQPDESEESGSEIEDANVKHSNLQTVLDPFPSIKEEEPEADNAAGGSSKTQSLSRTSKPDRAKSRRARVSASVYEPAQSLVPQAAREVEPAAANGEDFRQQMEALKMEVGESWLKVLARNQAGQVPAPSPGQKSSRNTQTEADAEAAAEARPATGKGAKDDGNQSGSPVVKVIKKSKKKPAATNVEAQIPGA